MITNIEELYALFEQNMPHRKWWDTDNLWEIAVGAILVQNTNWKNVDYSLANLRKETNFEPQKIAKLDLEKLQELIRPSGFFKNKAKGLHSLFSWFQAADFDLELLEKKDTATLREELLNISGIGPETADVLLVFVLNKSIFIADRYAQRIFQQLGVQESLNYQKLQNMIVWPENLTYLQAQSLHGWLVDYGQIHLKSEEAWQTGFLVGFQLKFENS